LSCLVIEDTETLFRIKRGLLNSKAKLLRDFSKIKPSILEKRFSRTEAIIQEIDEISKLLDLIESKIKQKIETVGNSVI